MVPLINGDVTQVLASGLAAPFQIETMMPDLTCLAEHLSQELFQAWFGARGVWKPAWLQLGLAEKGSQGQPAVSIVHTWCTWPQA